MSGVPAGVPVLPRDVARRLDHESRRAHRFHRFAHHPLCDEYAPEVFRVGGLVLCRGCVLGGLGIVLGLVAGWLVRPAWPWAAGAVLAGALSLAASRGKVGRRLVPALGLNFAIGAAVGAASPAHALVAAAATAFAGAAFLAWRRRGPNRSPCRVCPERTLAVCRGFAEIVRAEQAFRASAARAYDSAAHRPST